MKKYRMLERTNTRTSETVYVLQRHDWLLGWWTIGLHANRDFAWARWRALTRPCKVSDRVVAEAKVWR